MVFVMFSIGSAHLQPQEASRVMDAADVTMQQGKNIKQVTQIPTFST